MSRLIARRPAALPGAARDGVSTPFRLDPIEADKGRRECVRITLAGPLRPVSQTCENSLEYRIAERRYISPALRPATLADRRRALPSSSVLQQLCNEGHARQALPTTVLTAVPVLPPAGLPGARR